MNFVSTDEQIIKYNFIAVNCIAYMQINRGKFVLLVMICLLVPLFQGCRPLFVANPEKKAMKQQEKADREFEKNYSKIKKEHFRNQTRETRKRMKKNKKAAREINKPRELKSKKDCN